MLGCKLCDDLEVGADDDDDVEEAHV